LAYVGIGDVYSIASAFGFMNSKEGHLKALESAKSALNLNPNLAEAMITKARSTGFLYFDWDEVFKEYEEALLLQPNYVIGRYWYAWLLSGHKKFDLAEYQIYYANRIEPLSPTILSAAGWMALVNDSTDKAKSILEKALSIDPSFARTHFWLGQTLVFIGKYEKGLSHIEQSVELSNNNPLYIANQIFCLCEAGKLNDAETLYSSFFEAMSKNELEGYFPSYDKAIACIGLNKKEQALDFLEESYENRDSWIVYMAVDPRLSSLRNEARFKNLIEKVGLPN
jgi:Tfp pilus assembly protein PilF